MSLLLCLLLLVVFILLLWSLFIIIIWWWWWWWRIRIIRANLSILLHQSLCSCVIFLTLYCWETGESCTTRGNSLESSLPFLVFAFDSSLRWFGLYILHIFKITLTHYVDELNLFRVLFNRKHFHSWLVILFESLLLVLLLLLQLNGFFELILGVILRMISILISNYYILTIVAAFVIVVRILIKRCPWCRSQMIHKIKIWRCSSREKIDRRANCTPVIPRVWALLHLSSGPWGYILQLSKVITFRSSLNWG